MTRYPLTFSQENRFKKYQADPLRTDQNMFKCMVVLECKDPVKISDAVASCFSTIPSVWTSCHAVNGVLYQQVHAPRVVEIDYLDGVFSEDNVLPLLLTFARRPFALETVPLWRAALASVGDHYALCISIHHIAWDYFSWTPFLRMLEVALRETRSLPSTPDWTWIGEYAERQRRQFSLPSLSREHDSYFREVLNEQNVQPQQLPQRFPERSGMHVTTRTIKRQALRANSIMEESATAGYSLALSNAIQTLAPLPVYQIFSPINGRPAESKGRPGFFSSTLLFNVHAHWLSAPHEERMELVHQIRRAARYRHVPHLDDGAIERQGGSLAFTVNIVTDHSELSGAFRLLPVDKFTLFGDVQVAVRSAKDGDTLNIIGSQRCFDSASLESFADDVVQAALGRT